MMNFTNDEMNLMCIYDTGNKNGADKRPFRNAKGTEHG